MRHIPSGDRRSSGYAAAMAAALAALGATGPAGAAGDAAAPPAAALTALQCGHLIDTVHGKTLGATTVVIEGGKIKEVSIPSTTSA